MPTPPPTNTDSDIAVIGLACLFPGAPDLATFWRNILSKTSSITDPPPEAWDPNMFYDAASTENDRVYCKKGGYLGPIAYFDPTEHGIMPRAVEGGEPDQWLGLHVARQALRDAGYENGGPHGQRAALILGKGTYPNRGTVSGMNHGIVVDYTLRLLKTIHPELSDEDLQLVRADLKRRLPRFDAETAPALIPNVTVGRIANRLDFMGPSYTIDAACASSLVSIDIAAKGLRTGEYDLALVGGMQVATPVPVLSLFCRLKALSLTETIRPFDKDADGTLLSEGIGMAVLKRRADAERDGDRIYAFVKGSGIASDGRAVGVLAPRVEGEERAIRTAYDGAGISPRTIGLVEAHGTSTVVGDAVEVESLGRVFGERGSVARCALGSVKSMIGHTMPAAGMAGFIKVALSLYHKVLPPTLGVTEPNPRLKLERTPFYLNTETRPWIHGSTEHGRRGGINAFGFGGINGHVILEEASSASLPSTVVPPWDTEVFLFTGASRAEVIDLGRRVQVIAKRHASATLADLAAAVNTAYAGHDNRAAVLGIVASSRDDLTLKLERALSKLDEESCRRIKDVSGIYFFQEPLGRQGRLALLFPGEGAQSLNMLSDLCRNFPQARACFDRMDSYFVDHPRGYVLSDVVYPPPAFSDAERSKAEQRLWDLDVAVEALYTANQAMFTLLQDLGIKPDAVLGHSTGEYAAMFAAGMVDQQRYESRLHELNHVYHGASSQGTIPTRARLMALGTGREQIAELCRRFEEDVWVAMDNCPHQLVLAARPEVADQVEEILRTEGILYEVLSFDRPVHTPAFSEYAKELETFMVDLISRPPSVPLYSATSTTTYPSDMAGIHQLALDHWSRPVEFRKTIESMHADGIRLFVECGPRSNLTSFVDDILGRRSYAAIPSNVTRHSDTTQINHLVAQLAAHGVAITPEALYRHRKVSAVDLMDTAPPQRPRTTGRIKIPTGAPDMHLSADVAARIRNVTRAFARGTAPAPVATQGVARTEVSTPAVSAKAEEPPPARSTITASSPIAAAPRPAERSPETDGGAEQSQTAPEALVTALDAPDTGTAAQVMTSFLGTMESFLQLQHDLITGMLGSRPELPQVAAWNADAVEDGRQFPLLDAVVEHAGQSLVARASLDLDRCPGLRDHTLGRNVSADDPSLTGLSIVPFTMLMEVMAEAAAALVPARVVNGMKSVRVHRWVAVDPGPVVLEAHATLGEDGRIAVRLFEPAAGQNPVAEAIIVMAPAYDPAPQAEPLPLTEVQPYKWRPEQMYTHAMFHGPAFRGVQTMSRVGRDGAEANLVIEDRSSLFAPDRADGLVTDFVLLDLPGQVVGFWASHFLERGFLVLPFTMESLTLYGPLLPAGERLTCQTRIALVGEHQVRASMDVIRADGTIYAHFDGWEDRRFDVPPAAQQALVSPGDARLSESWRMTGAESFEGLAGARIGGDRLPRSWLTAHGNLWTRVLVNIVLSGRERALWHALPASDSRRIEWLMGRIAAKDAVRDYVQQTFGLPLHAADVELIPDAHGKPLVEGDWLARVPRAPFVSLSHVEGVALAVAGDRHALFGLGIDLERLGRMTPEMAAIAFSDVELDLLASLSARDRNTWTLRLWCAKEACAKAVGTGFASGFRSFAVRHVDAMLGTVSVRCDTKDGSSFDLAANTVQDGEWIVAVCAATAEESVPS